MLLLTFCVNIYYSAVCNATTVNVGNNADFNSATQTAIISARSNGSTINIGVTNDNIVEGNEVFTMNLDIPPSFGPGVIAGGITTATATIIDTTSTSHSMIVL